MMRKTKEKRDSRWQTQILPFVVVWAVSIGAGAVISQLWHEGNPNITFVSSVILTGLVQVFLVERLLKRSMRGWMLYTIASLFIIVLLDSLLALGFVRLTLLQSVYPLVGEDTFWLVSSLTINVPTSLLQFVWLRQRVHRAWLWPLITIITLSAFSAIRLSDNYQFIETIMILSISIIQASLMHTLWSHPKNTEKTKIDFAADQQSDEKRIERLQERERSNPLWNIGDEQALQSEA